MPGPVSDSFDPEFGTTTNVEIVREASKLVSEKLNRILNAPPRNIIDVCVEGPGKSLTPHLTEKELRIIRFHLNRSLDIL